MGLRLATGVFRTSPVLILHAEANELSLERRQMYLSAVYVLRVRSTSDHTFFQGATSERYERAYRYKPPIVTP